jgi:hypothetical protein
MAQHPKDIENSLLTTNLKSQQPIFLVISIFICYNPLKMARKLVSFDWAMKKILRQKANFGILEVGEV